MNITAATNKQHHLYITNKGWDFGEKYFCSRSSRDRNEIFQQSSVMSAESEGKNLNTSFEFPVSDYIHLLCSTNTTNSYIWQTFTKGASGAVLPSLGHAPLMTYHRLSPVLLVGSSVVRWVLTYYSHVAVFVHYALTFLEDWPLVWEGSWHQGLLINRKKKVRLSVLKKGVSHTFNSSWGKQVSNQYAYH